MTILAKEQIVRSVVNNLYEEGQDIETFLDPLTLSIISLVISSLFQIAHLYCKIKTASEIQKVCVKPSFLQKRIVRQKISFYDINNYLTYRQRRKLATVILKTGASTDIDKIEQALNEEEYGEWEV